MVSKTILSVRYFAVLGRSAVTMELNVVLEDRVIYPLSHPEGTRAQ